MTDDEVPLSRQPACPACAPHEHHLLGCEPPCDCHVRDPFGVIPD